MQAYIFLAAGFEEIEAVAPIDILRRAGITVTLVGVNGREVTGSHGITVTADTAIDGNGEAAVLINGGDIVILPGGMPGTVNLNESAAVRSAAKAAVERGMLCAICAAPRIPGLLGLLDGKRATCYPGNEQYLSGAVCTGERVTVDGNIITARGAGAAVEFGLAIVDEVCGREAAEKLAAAIIAK